MYLFNALNSQVATLVNTKEILSDNIAIDVTHSLKLTMVDGKVTHCITNTGSLQLCLICGSSPKHMNDLYYVYSLPIKESTIQYGLSTLHCWIRCMEMFLKIAYRLDVKSWRLQGEDVKEQVTAKKTLIKKKL